MACRTLVARTHFAAIALLCTCAGTAHAQFTVNVGYDAPDANLLDGVADADLATPGLQTTLRAAIQELNILPVGPAYSITFAHNAPLLSFGGVGEDLAVVGDLDIRNSVVIRGNGQGLTTIDGSAHADRVFHVISIPGIQVEIRDLSINDGTSPTSAFGPGQGGAIKHDGGELVVDNVAFVRNRAIGSTSSDGGAIHSSARLITNGCYFESNRAGGNGGAIHAGAYHGAVNDFYIQNIANRRGGAVHATTFHDTITCTYDSNRATLQGGAVYVAFGGQGSFLYDEFRSNESASSGGAIANAGTMNVFECRFTTNHCTGSGGAIRASEATTIERTTLDGNVADSFGGAIAVDFSAVVSILDIDAFLNIAAQSGGAISNGGSTTLHRSTLRDNFANGLASSDAGGAGVYNLGTIEIVNSTICFNHAPSGLGAGILNSGFNSVVDSTSNTIAYNDSVDGTSVYNGSSFGPASFNSTYTAFYSPFPGNGIAGPSPVSSLGWNFDADGTGALTGPGDQAGSPGLPWDPMLTPPLLVPGARGPMLLPILTSPLRQAGGPGPIVTPSGVVIPEDQAQRLRPPHSADIGAAQELCRADYNHDGIGDILDFLDFLNDFGNLDPRADLNLDGIVDILDFLDFMNWFGAGCP